MGGLRRLRTVMTTAVSCAAATAVASAAWAAPAVDPAPTPVKTRPGVVETAPVSSGGWFGWQQGSAHTTGSVESGSFFVERDGRAAVRVNERGTTAAGAGIVGSTVFYAQQRGARKPRLLSYDLRTGRRAVLPDAVNLARWRGRPTTILGDVSASGPWILFTRRVESTDDYPTDQVVLYHRGNRTIRVLDSALTDYADTGAAQVDGRYATYQTYGFDGAGSFDTGVVRYDIRTGRRTTVEYLYDDSSEEEQDVVTLHDPAVDADGTLYFWRSTQVSTDPATYRRDLVRLPVGGPREVVASLAGGRPDETFVRDRADGDASVFYSVDGDIYRLDL